MPIILKDKIVVEVFKTTVDNMDSAAIVVNKLKELIPGAKINFDLDDCDNILRIEALQSEINVKAILQFIRKQNIGIEVLL